MLTVFRSACSTDVLLPVSETLAASGCRPADQVGPSVGPGRLFVSLPSVRAAPREPGARCGARKGVVLPRASVVVRGGRCSEGSSFLVCPPRRTDTEAKRRKAASVRSTAHRKRRAFRSHGSVFARTRTVSALVVASRTPLAATAPFRGRQEVRSPRHSAVASRRTRSDGGEA